MIEFYTVENTGWSGGVSWFRTGGTEANPTRFKTYSEANQYAIKQKKNINDPGMFWRVVRTTIIRDIDSEVICKKWDMV